MNIFFLDKNPVVCASYHNDKHVVKMILETAQLLSTAHRILDGNSSSNYKLCDPTRDYLLYKPTHINHPCAKWVRETSGNYIWAFDLFIALLDEYQKRYWKYHACGRLGPVLNILPYNIKTGQMTPPALAVGDIKKKCKYTSQDSTQTALVMYRTYYVARKDHLAKWRNGVPGWWPDQQRIKDIKDFYAEV